METLSAPGLSSSATLPDKPVSLVVAVRNMDTKTVAYVRIELLVLLIFFVRVYPCPVFGSHNFVPVLNVKGETEKGFHLHSILR
jgi:hypothetical protein